VTIQIDETRLIDQYKSAQPRNMSHDNWHICEYVPYNCTLSHLVDMTNEILSQMALEICRSAVKKILE
jgi:hypothetical protein